uniref:Murein endopeptidase K n=1 Tax=Caulobacter sp. (strain K31) TaxID=366602 RepID=B0T3M5_CAUSK
MIERRKLLGLGLGALGASAIGPMAAFAQAKLSGTDLIGDLLQRQSDLAEGLPAEGLAAQAAPVATPVASVGPAAHAPRWLKLHNIHTQEKLEAVYFEKGEYVPDAVQALDKVLRDYRTGDVYSMHPELFDTLADLARKTETKAHFQVISGYRSPKTNAMLHERSGQVAKRSLHMDGKAIDIYLEDVALDRVRAAALDVGRGGVGYYPVSNFVHVDVGPVRRWVGS